MKFDCKYDAMLEIEKIVRHPRNNNMHPIEQIEAFQRIISKKGIWRIPLIISKKSGYLVAGHLRLTVAENMGIEKLPVVYQDFENEADEYQFLTFDNEIARWAQLNRHDVHLALEEIEGLEIDDLGIKDWDLKTEYQEIEGEDDAPAIDETKTIATLGDIWILGNHRVMCGDSTVVTDVEKLMDGQKVDMVFTDPPYGINESGDRKTRRGAYPGQEYKSFIDDSISYAIDAYNICQTLDIKRQVWWGANYYSHHIPQTGNWFVWDKRVEEKQKNTNSDCELAYVKSEFSSVRIFRHLWKGMVKDSENGKKRVHPTQKPIALAEWAFNYFKNIESVLDLFLGSGSTLIACEKTNRKCYGMELDPKYVDVIIKRWQEFTGKHAILESTGQRFDDFDDEKLNKALKR